MAYCNLNSLLVDADLSKDKLPSIQAFADGSYSSYADDGGCGLYIIDTSTDTVLLEKFVRARDPELELQGVGSSLYYELNSVLLVLKWAVDNNCTNIRIFYDCEAVRHSLSLSRLRNELMYEFRCKASEYFNKVDVLFTLCNRDSLQHQRAHELSQSYFYMNDTDSEKILEGVL